MGFDTADNNGTMRALRQITTRSARPGLTKGENEMGRGFTNGLEWRLAHGLEPGVAGPRPTTRDPMRAAAYNQSEGKVPLSKFMNGMEWRQAMGLEPVSPSVALQPLPRMRR